MKSMAKKMVIFAMVGIMQIGFGASVMEASPLHDYYPPVQSYDEHNRDHMEREVMNVWNGKDMNVNGLKMNVMSVK